MEEEAAEQLSLMITNLPCLSLVCGPAIGGDVTTN
jgi:hypothetical protein